MVVKPLPDVVLRCTRKLDSALELSVQVRLMLLDEVAVAPNPVGAVGGVGAGEPSVVAEASLEKPESPALLVA